MFVVSYFKNNGLLCVFTYVLNSFNCIWFIATLWTIAHQPPLSMGFSRQECWSGLPLPSHGLL